MALKFGALALLLVRAEVKPASEQQQVNQTRARDPIEKPALDCTGQRKHQDGGKQIGGSPCNLKMTNSAEIIRAGDR